VEIKPLCGVSALGGGRTHRTRGTVPLRGTTSGHRRLQRARWMGRKMVLFGWVPATSDGGCDRGLKRFEICTLDGVFWGQISSLNWTAEQVLFALDACYSFLALLWV
jgi:hypothetical protein